MKHFEFSKDTFRRMGMAASDDAFSILLNMEMMFDDLDGIDEIDAYKEVDKCLDRYDPLGLDAINAAFFDACGEWREENFDEEDYKDRKVCEYIHAVCVEAMSLIAAFMGLYFKDEGGKGFILGYIKM